MSEITKKAIAESLIKLAKTKPFDKITVTDIVNDCGVNRMTFYYHFQDIYDLVNWILLDKGSEILDGKTSYDNWQEGLKKILDEMLSYKEIIINAYSSINRETLDRYLNQVTFKLLYDVVNEEAKGFNISPDDKKFIASFYSYAFVGLTLDWVLKGMKEKPEILVEKLSILIKGNIPEAIRKYSKVK
jgi:probable dihydroxyacetone kinase regulator